MKSNKVQDRILDANEKKLIDKFRDHLESKNLTAKLVIELKQRDKGDRRMLALLDLQGAIKAMNLAFSTKEFDDLIRIIKPNHENKYAYMDLLILLFGTFQAQNLASQSIIQLEQGTKSSSVAFKIPGTIQQAKTSRLGLIGEALIKTQQNYEEALLKTSGDVNRVKPVINEALIKTALTSLGVKDLPQEIMMELN